MKNLLIILFLLFLSSFAKADLLVPVETKGCGDLYYTKPQECKAKGLVASKLECRENSETYILCICDPDKYPYPEISDDGVWEYKGIGAFCEDSRGKFYAQRVRSNLKKDETKYCDYSKYPFTEPYDDGFWVYHGTGFSCTDSLGKHYEKMIRSHLKKK